MKASLLSLALLVPSIAYSQTYPTPTPAMQAIIDKDNGRHFGTSPEDAGPIQTDLSPALNPAAIDKAIRKVADWQLKESEPYFDRIWTWSVLYSGFIAASEATGDPKYSDAMTTMSKHFNWELRSQLPNADDQSVGQTYLDLYLAKGSSKDKSTIAPTEAALDSVLPLKTLKPNDPRIPWWWCDALFMAPPVWSRTYAATGDHKYIDYIDAQWQATSDLLYNQQEHLYARDASYKTRTEANGRLMFWSRGEGWVMGGIARTLMYLPKDDPQRPFYIQQLREMATRVAALQDTNGLWHAGLLDPQTYPLPEVSGSALFTFAMAWGVNNGILDRKVYEPVVTKAWAGMLQHIYADGRLGCIQQTGAEPAFYRPTASYNYGVGAFLMAGAEVKKMSHPHGSTMHKAK